ncbi:hypothetical protein CONPUDRAFT_134494 [Coniophora puteana RWD-64-598 SS2]|uniref:MYND-type domain-containing protein n=1 Tax=Coniophora puteana (strain RWD-64-598) TaxID=741705 RepID=A0A5M3N8R8_CONPW|nr:uncharacterized protein CONPUDRAFT_134494 [Coniophora puteana RWD-64-598 SS2]EIW87235.1 hypothetical protein CONPUDRAFT_134494 [Coniophora puteana RWD-64-598 SS2]
MQLNFVASRKKMYKIDYQRLRHFREENQRLYDGLVTVLRTIAGELLDNHDHQDWFSLVSAATRKEIICEGFERAGRRSGIGHDARMLCPELNSSDLLKGRGKGLWDLYDKAIVLDDGGSMVNFDDTFIRSEWWRSAYGDGTVLRFIPEVSKFCYEFITCLRTEYLIYFVLHTLRVIVKGCHNFTKGTPADSIVANRVLYNLNPLTSQKLLEDKKHQNSRSALTCENCQRKRKDVGVKFKSCKACKHKLNFEVLYCSSVCQKADWPEHKAHCGKEKVSKNRIACRPEYSYSIALQLQVKMHDYYSTDYVLFSRSEDPEGYDVSFCNDDDKGDMFLDLFNALLIDAEKPGLDVIAKCLVDAVDDYVECGITREDIIAQLTEEYEVDVRTLLEKLEATLAVEDDKERYKGMVIQELQLDDDSQDSDSSGSDGEDSDIDESGTEVSLPQAVSPARSSPKSQQKGRADTATADDRTLTPVGVSSPA